MVDQSASQPVSRSTKQPVGIVRSTEKPADSGSAPAVRDKKIVVAVIETHCQSNTLARDSQTDRRTASQCADGEDLCSDRRISVEPW